MASQREIRRRIGAVRNIKQITRAMQFVAASKLKRAQDATLAARPYSEKIDEVLADLAAVLGGEEHPLLARREGGKRCIVLITTDRGLAGPLNTNTIRFAARIITEHPGDRRSVTWEHLDPRDGSRVVLAAALINRMKADLTEEQFRGMVKALADHFEHPGVPFDKSAWPS